MKKYAISLFILFFFFLYSNFVTATTIKGNVNTEFYSYESADSENNTHIRSLQGANLRIVDLFIPKLEIYFNGRIASDISNKFSTDPDLRIYGGYIKYSTSKNFLSLKIGRQFTNVGLSGFTIDGASIKVNYKKLLQFTAFAGSTPGRTFYNYDKINDWDKSNAFGARVKCKTSRKFNFGFSYLKRNYEDYTDLHLTGLDISYAEKQISMLGRIDYDIYWNRIKKITFRPNYKHKKGHYITVAYLYKYPSFNNNNIFSVFKANPFHQIRLNPVFKIKPNIYVTSSFTYTNYYDTNNMTAKIGGIYNSHSAGIILNNGFSGQKFGVYSFLSFDIDSKLNLYSGINLYDYKLDNDYDEFTTDFSGSFGFNYKFAKGLSSQFEIQTLNTKYHSDLRLYLKINYSFRHKISNH